MVGFWIRAGATGLKTIKGVKPGTKFKGQSTIEEIKKKGKEFKKKIKSEESKKEFRKSGFYKYFTNQ